MMFVHQVESLLKCSWLALGRCAVFWPQLARQEIVTFVAAALPVRVSRTSLNDVQAAHVFLTTGYLCAALKGQLAEQKVWQVLHLPLETFRHFLCNAVVHLARQAKRVSRSINSCSISVTTPDRG